MARVAVEGLAAPRLQHGLRGCAAARTAKVRAANGPASSPSRLCLTALASKELKRCNPRLNLDSIHGHNAHRLAEPDFSVHPPVAHAVHSSGRSFLIMFANRYPLPRSERERPGWSATFLLTAYVKRRLDQGGSDESRFAQANRPTQSCLTSGSLDGVPVMQNSREHKRQNFRGWGLHPIRTHPLAKWVRGRSSTANR
jgi:hypothetical protein